MKRFLTLLLAAAMTLSLAACGGETTPAETTAPAETSAPVETTAPVETDAPEADLLAETTIYVDIAASLSAAFEEIVSMYAEVQPNVTVALNAGSSGTLQKQIQEANGLGHDIFFSAGVKQVKALQEEGMVTEGSRVDLLANALCLVTGNGTETAVTGWDDLSAANNMALCDGTVPVGSYTRKALVALGVLAEVEDPAAYTSAEVSEALGGVEINECADVSAAAQAVAEGSNEIGTIYYTDYYGYKDQLTILALDEAGELTGAITYPVCQIINGEADEAELAAAADFLAFLQSEEVLAVYAEYCFVVNG